VSSFTDDDAAGFDLVAMLGEGVADEKGRLRGELQGEGALGAAIQFERSGVTVDDVTLAVSQLHSEALGIEITAADYPGELQTIVDAGRTATPRETERMLFIEWLAAVPGLMNMRAQARGA
jgi:hypothetical protein